MFSSSFGPRAQEAEHHWSRRYHTSGTTETHFLPQTWLWWSSLQVIRRFFPEEVGSVCLRNVATILPNYMVSSDFVYVKNASRKQ